MKIENAFYIFLIFSHRNKVNAKKRIFTNAMLKKLGTGTMNSIIEVQPLTSKDFQYISIYSYAFNGLRYKFLIYSKINDSIIFRLALQAVNTVNIVTLPDEEQKVTFV